MEDHKFTGNKTKNHFTAYLQKSIRWKRYHYLQKKEKYQDMIKPLDEILTYEIDLTFEDVIESNCQKNFLLKERGSDYPKWNELSDEKLVNALLLLSKTERQLIYQHVFEEQTFKQMAQLHGLTDVRVKSIYYYAICKIRKWMGGEK